MFCSVSKNLEDGTILQYFMIWGALNNISVSKICKYKSIYTDLYSVCQEIESIRNHYYSMWKMESPEPC